MEAVHGRQGTPQRETPQKFDFGLDTTSAQTRKFRQTNRIHDVFGNGETVKQNMLLKAREET